MNGMRRLVIATALLCALALASSCTGDDEPPDAGTPGAAVTPLGAITRLPGGTAVPSDPRTLLGIACAGDSLSVTTDREVLRAAMPCDRLLPESITSKFTGKPIVIRYEGGRLKIDNAQEGTMEFPSEPPVVTPNR